MEKDKLVHASQLHKIWKTHHEYKSNVECSFHVKIDRLRKREKRCPCANLWYWSFPGTVFPFLCIVIQYLVLYFLRG